MTSSVLESSLQAHTADVRFSTSTFALAKAAEISSWEPYAIDPDLLGFAAFNGVTSGVGDDNDSTLSLDGPKLIPLPAAWGLALTEAVGVGCSLVVPGMIRFTGAAACAEALLVDARRTFGLPDRMLAAAWSDLGCPQWQYPEETAKRSTEKLSQGCEVCFCVDRDASTVFIFKPGQRPLDAADDANAEWSSFKYPHSHMLYVRDARSTLKSAHAMLSRLHNYLLRF
jgi:hypothetical protein